MVNTHTTYNIYNILKANTKRESERGIGRTYSLYIHYTYRKAKVDCWLPNTACYRLLKSRIAEKQKVKLKRVSAGECKATQTQTQTQTQSAEQSAELSRLLACAVRATLGPRATPDLHTYISLFIKTNSIFCHIYTINNKICAVETKITTKNTYKNTFLWIKISRKIP